MKKSFIRIVGVLLAAVMMVSLCACSGGGSEKDDGITGKYNCIAQENADGELAPPDFDSYLDLKKGGKGVYNIGWDLDLKWSYDGETFTASYTAFNAESEIVGTLKDGVLDVMDGGAHVRFLKEGAECPDWASPTGESDGDFDYSMDMDRFAGDYYLNSMMENGTMVDSAALEQSGIADKTYLRINSDKTGTYAYNGEAEREFTIDEWAGKFNFTDGTSLNYFEEGTGSISVMDFDKNITLYFHRYGDETEGGNGTMDLKEGQFPPAVTWDYTGDWVGQAVLYDCTGDFDTNNGAACHVVSRIVFDDDGYATVYVKFSVGSDDKMNMKNLTVTYDEAEGDMLLHGNFYGQELTDESFISYVADEGLLYINAAINRNSSDLKIVGCLKHIGSEWTGDEYLSLDSAYADYYANMTLEEIADYIQVSTDDLPPLF